MNVDRSDANQHYIIPSSRPPAIAGSAFHVTIHFRFFKILFWSWEGSPGWGGSTLKRVSSPTCSTFEFRRNGWKLIYRPNNVRENLSTENLNFKLQSEQKLPCWPEFIRWENAPRTLPHFALGLFTQFCAPEMDFFNVLARSGAFPESAESSSCSKGKRKTQFSGLSPKRSSLLICSLLQPRSFHKRDGKSAIKRAAGADSGPSVVVFAFPIKRFTFIASARKRKTRGIYVLAEAVSGDGAAYLISAAPPIALNPEAFE